ncbi:hypothetical protein [Rufibacter psychrotolerans]|uniref:hypothetical protein n=1 Tax=Rufibacter psychrotolerans TaxID=2812556 RepID=UPI001967FE50|nr:hypothetical protein [Rufibacter sp. SYSU D00308]
MKYMLGRQLFPVALLLVGSLALSCRPSCPINSCQTRMVHRHGEGEYRGMPWYKKQNPRIGEKLPKPSKEMKQEMSGKSSRKKAKN